MSAEILRSTVRELVDYLVHGDYELFFQRCAKSRPKSNEVRKVILDYGHTLVSPPKDAYQNLDAVKVKAASLPTWSVRAPLWTEDEGRSDLTLEFTITLGQGKPTVELEDLHVL